MVAGLTLVCPVRGRLKAKSRSADGLTPTEEKLRVEAIRHLIERGYPKENIRVEAVLKRFGSSGRNSFRADLAVLDVPVSTIHGDDVDSLLAHSIVLGEVKRDNASAVAAKSYQVRPMLDFATKSDCVALYWDDVEQRVYWHVWEKGNKLEREGPLSDLPAPGQKPGATLLTFATIDPSKSLLAVFERVEDLMHAGSIGQSKRFNIMLQLLLAKLYDEHMHSSMPTEPLTLQDFDAVGASAAAAISTTNTLLKQAVQYYKAFLPEPVSEKLAVPGDILIDIMRILAPVKILSMKQNVIQDFYMYFARHIYKWDLAQYFTPTSVTDFIVEVLNPQFGERVKDPACGSADFLTAAFRRGQHWPDYASSVWGSDVSREAVQVAVLNMILNGDGKTNIRQEDSLLKISAQQESCDIVICNPPFGTRITERRQEALENFDLGHAWMLDKGHWKMTNRLLEKQEAGILFAEVCTRLIRPSGRFALVVPNGYLGNRSERYSVLREWLLRNCRFAVIVGLPRFTFKTSGADVSASIIFCEKREIPLSDSSDAEDHEFCVEIIDRTGWKLGDKRGEPVYRRDPSDGTLVLDESDDLILDSDFGEILRRIRASDAAQYFPWLVDGLPSSEEQPGWTVSNESIINDKHRTLDPKRNCRKFASLRASVMSQDYFRLGDVAEVVAEGTGTQGSDQGLIDPAKTYRHIEITDVGIGTYRWQLRRGWELPSRARHRAEPGDIYVGAIWSSVRKWFLAADGTKDTIVTNGLHRLRLRPGKDGYLLDLIVGLCSESYATQMRGLARGSDGLAEIPERDLLEVVLPKVTDSTTRADMQPFVDQLSAGFTSVESKVTAITLSGELPIPIPSARSDHTSII